MGYLGERLASLLNSYKNISSIEDISCILGVVIDILRASHTNYHCHATVIESFLPSFVKLLDLICSRKIKLRQYYLFISHRLIEIFSWLIIPLKKTTDF